MVEMGITMFNEFADDDYATAYDWKVETYGDRCPGCGTLRWGGDCPKCYDEIDFLPAGFFPMPADFYAPVLSIEEALMPGRTSEDFEDIEF